MEKVKTATLTVNGVEVGKITVPAVDRLPDGERPHFPLWLLGTKNQTILEMNVRASFVRLGLKMGPWKAGTFQAKETDDTYDFTVETDGEVRVE